MLPDYPTWLEIDLAAVEQNCRLILRDTGTPLMAVVKGEAYGHGAAAVAQAALKGGASWLGVARFGEARSLCQAGIQAPILVLGMATSAEVDEAITSQVTLTLYNEEMLALYASRARAVGGTVRVHIKVDSGMGRLGVFAEEALAFTRQAQAVGGILIDGLYSHLAVAEELHALNDLQIQRFDQAVQALQTAGLRPRWVHLANSAAAFYLPQSRYNLVRIGNVVLGLRIRVDAPLPSEYFPALAWKAQLAACRRLPAGWGVGYGQTYVTQSEELVGVVPVGYGDGLRRVPGNQVLVGGEICPAVGKLSLDSMTVRLPRSFPAGEEVVLVGKQDEAAIWVHDLAQLYQTSQVDVTTGIHARVPRIYK